MQDRKYEELEHRAVEALESARSGDLIRRLEAQVTVRDQIEKMRASGEALTLSEEEIGMLAEFRRFKLRMRRDGEVFRWQTRRSGDVEIVADTALVEQASRLP